MTSTADATMPLLTNSQREVVLTTGAHLLVGAGAGSGKTSTVVQAICHLLGAPITDQIGNVHRTVEPLRLDDIAAITFTNQAAADLKRKLRQALRQSGLRPLAGEVDGARIGTIHAFCGALLREFALQAGLPPSVHVLDDSDASSLVASCAEAALLEALESSDATALAPLTNGRQLRDVLSAIAQLSSDSDRLAAYAKRADELRDHEQLLLQLATRASELRQHRLAERGEYDFDRMIVAARDLLREHDDVRHAVQQRIRVLVVDEFQDVDPTQRDMALLLGGWHTNDPDPTRLMLIGDPKQSIFRFRRADVTLWHEVAEAFNADPATRGRQRELTENFRSRKGILAFVDRLFGAALDRAVSDTGERMPFEVAYKALAASGAHAEGDRCVELLCVPADEAGKARNATSARDIEARAVAERVVELHQDGRAYGDIAMLLSSWTDADVYERALRERNVPVYLLRAEGFWDTREVLDCLLTLRAIGDTHDPVSDVAALVGFLKSPFVGVLDETLFALSQHPGGWREAMRTEARERALLDRAVAMLERFGALRDQVPLNALIETLVMDSGYLAALVVDPVRGMQAVANLRKLVRLSGEAREQSMGEWLRNVADARARGDLVPEERLYRERADVVTITSIHSAKGLEWPVVFWCDLLREVNVQYPPLLLGRELFRLRDVRLLDDNGKVSDTQYNALHTDIGFEHQAESRRLWYVAATRARELLVLSGVRLGATRRGGESVCSLLLGELEESLSQAPLPDAIPYQHADGTSFTLVVRSVGVPDAEGATAVDVPNANIADNGSEETVFDTLHTDALIAPPPPVGVPMGRTRLSATQLMHYASSPAHWRGQYVSGLPSSMANANGGNPLDARALGTMVHQVMEQYGGELNDLEELVENALALHSGSESVGEANEGMMARYRAAVHAIVEQALQHPRWRELAALPGARRELAFTRILPDGSVIDGAMDLVAVDGGINRIADVKTGRDVGADTLAERYALQAAVYGSAAEAITGRPAEFELLLVNGDGVVPVPIDSDRVTQVVQALRAGVGIPTPARVAD